MAAHFLRLRLEILRNTFRRRPLVLAGMIIGLLYLVAIGVLSVIGFAALRDMSADIARVIVIVGGGAVLLGFALVPLAFGADDSLDPRRFVLFGIPTTRLCLYLLVAALVSLPAVFLVVLAIAQAVTWSREGALAYALLVIPVIVATGILLSRLTAAVAGYWLSTRRSREATGTILLVLLAALAPAVAVLATLDWESHALPILRRIAAVVTWTPLGAVWAVPADVANGRPDEALAKLAIALGFIAVVALAWRALVARMLVNPGREVARRRHTGLGWFDRLPGSPVGAVAARSLSYWSRDRRYVLALAVVPILPVIVVGAFWVAGVPWEAIAWLPVPIMCLFVGWTVHNDVAQDSTAFWLHLSTSTSGAADRWGRIVPPLAVGIPLAVVGSVVTSTLTGSWEALPALLALSITALFAALGVSSVSSAAYPYATARPGDSPFAQPQAAGATGTVVQAVSFGVILLLAAPTIWLIAVGSLTAATIVGFGIGLAALVGGAFWGARIVDRHSPELLEFTLQN